MDPSPSAPRFHPLSGRVRVTGSPAKGSAQRYFEARPATISGFDLLVSGPGPQSRSVQRKSAANPFDAEHRRLS